MQIPCTKLDINRLLLSCLLLFFVLTATRRPLGVCSSASHRCAFLLRGEVHYSVSDAAALAVLAVPAVVRGVGFASFTSVCPYPRIQGFSFPVYGSSRYLKRFLSGYFHPVWSASVWHSSFRIAVLHLCDMLVFPACW